MSESNKNWFAKHKILTAIIVIVGLLIIGGATSGTNNSQQNNSQTDTTSATKKPTLDIKTFYSKVENGMTKKQVLELSNKEPGECTESETQGFGKYEICNWYGGLSDNTFVTVSFQNGKVDSKTKTGF